MSSWQSNESDAQVFRVVNVRFVFRILTCRGTSPDPDEIAPRVFYLLFDATSAEDHSLEFDGFVFFSVFVMAARGSYFNKMRERAWLGTFVYTMSTSRFYE